MRRLLFLTALLLAFGPLSAAEHSRPARLPEKEITDGWLLLFDGESTFGWHAVNDSKYTISLGMIAPQADSKAPLLVTNTGFDNYELRLEYQVKQQATVLVGCDKDGKNAGNNDVVNLRSFGDWMQAVVVVKAGRIEQQRTTQLGRDYSFFSTSASTSVEGQPAPRGNHIALSGSGVVYRNIRLKPLDLQPIFNGADLGGWKEHPGKKSKFTVADRAITIKNGPGDLQTEGQWADFVLQLECISNGKELNSGVFFRCIPGEYQQGYEAQVHNGFTEQPMKEYTLEDFDPETHKRIGSHMEKYTATDYGTGAIYRRQPARKQMAKDNEWFGMTVVAQGRHMAVWVNGVQVTDWTDNRPEDKNARNGCKLGKGAISLQGHDPTTDLSFRNFRLGELGKNTEKKEPEKKEPEKKE